jgi:hypothetical protein
MSVTHLELEQRDHPKSEILQIKKLLNRKRKVINYSLVKPIERMIDL